MKGDVRIHWRSVAPLLATLVLGLALLPGFASHLTPDGISYLSIAGHYADGRVDDAVNAYWSPLFSWLMAPLIAVGLTGPVAAKLLNLVVAIGAMWAVRRLARTVGATAWGVQAMSWALVLPLVAAAYSFITPDLLVTIPVLLALEQLVRLLRDGRVGHGVLAGIGLGVAYLAKLFALPFAAAVLAVTAGVALTATKPRGSRLPGVGAALVVVLTFVGGWGTALAQKYDDGFTVGTAGAANVDYLAPESPGNASQWAGLIPPPHDHAVSAWEDPAAVELDEIEGVDGEPVEDAERDASPGDLVSRGSSQIGDLLSAAWGWFPVVLAAVALPVALRLRPTGKRAPKAAAPPVDVRELIVPGAAAAIWAGGVLLTYAETRYLWAALLVAAALGALALDAWQRTRPRADGPKLAAVVLVVLMLPAAISLLQQEWRISDPVVRVADSLEDQVDLEDRRVASNTNWPGMKGACFALDCRYYGVPPGDATTEQFRDQLDRYEIEFLAVTGVPPADLVDGEPVATVPQYNLSVYRLR